jgi:hypothetical protein
MQKLKKKMGRITRTSAMIGAIMALILPGTVGVAVASPGTSVRDVKAIVHSVFASSNPEVAILALSAPERALFIDSFNHLTSDTFVTPNLPVPSPDTSSGMGAPATLTLTSTAIVPMATSGCWYHYEFKSWYDLGIHTGDTWMQLNWCSNGSAITSYYASNLGGAGYSGVSYDGISGQYQNNLGWEVRYAVGYRFHIGIVSANPCMQIRGGATGLYSYQSSCNLS